MRNPFLLLVILLMAGGPLGAQSISTNVDEPEIDSTLLYIKAYAYGDSIDLKWIPIDPERWEQALTHGYRITRRTLRPDGTPDPATATILAGNTSSDRIRPQGPLWFAENGDLEPDSLIASVGRALYDPELNTGPRGGSNTVERYKFVLFCAEQSADAYFSIGGFFRDITVVPGLSYQYTVESLDDSGRRVSFNSVSIMGANGEFEQVPFGFFPKPDLAGSQTGGLDDMNYTLNQIILSARSYGDSIALRWAPNNPSFWRDANQIGYFLIRLDVNQATGEIDTSTRKLIIDPSRKKFIMPWDSTIFLQNRNEADDLVKVAAQVLYGKTFNLPSENFLNQGSDLENRYAFALIAAEKSARAADALGLRFVDREVEPGKTYRYEISTVIDTFFTAAYTLYVKNEASPGQKPFLFTAQENDHSIVLRWDKNFNKQLFSSYRLERSDDGGRTFFPLNSSNLLLPDNEDYEDYTFTFRDSVPENYKTYRYRLYGQTSFAEWSPPAELTAIGRDRTPPPNPSILKPDQTGDGSVKLSWTMVEEPDDLAGYLVLLGSKDDGLFEPVFNNPLPPGTREYTYTVDSFRTDTAYYFEIAAVDTAGNQSESFPVFMNIVDSIPPAPPLNLNGIVDTNGLVTLVWEMGTEADLAGYRVFFSNDTTYEFTQLTVSPVEYNFYLDTIEIKTLTEEIYYKVQAVDIRFNRSDFSKVLPLQRPDLIPPVTPVFRQPEVSADSIVLQWSPSVSEDVVQHILYRRMYQDDAAGWVELAILGSKDSMYLDTSAVVEQLYEYSLRALDDAGWFSDYAFPVKGRRWFSDELLLVTGLTAALDAEKKSVIIKWTYSPPSEGLLNGETYRFFLYRAVGDGPMERFRQIAGETYDYIDARLIKDQPLHYAVKVVFRDGKTSPMSDIVTVPAADQ